MLPDRVSNPGPLIYQSGVLPIALRGPARSLRASDMTISRKLLKRVGKRRQLFLNQLVQPSPVLPFNGNALVALVSML